MVTFGEEVLRTDGMLAAVAHYRSMLFRCHSAINHKPNEQGHTLTCNIFINGLPPASSEVYK